MTTHACAILCIALFCVSAPAEDWTHYGRDEGRVSSSPLSLRPEDSIGAAQWTTSVGPGGESLAFLGQSSVVQSGDHVVALGWVDGVFAAIDVFASTGAVRWWTPVAAPTLDSWSSPAIDANNQCVIVASATQLQALDLQTGAVRWTANTQNDIANASPMVTTDLGLRDRALITDFGFSGQSGLLYAINVDPFDPVENPYQPGQIVWSVGVGPLSGASPARFEDKVIIATSDGRIAAYPIDTAAPPEPVWESFNPTGLGFFGTISVRGGFAYAASYAFNGGQLAANLVKLDASDGTVIWSTPSNRTDAIPIPTDDGHILLSSGLVGFGSMPSLQLFEDLGSSASLLWDTFLDGGPTLGYWTHTPIVIESPHGLQAIVSEPPQGDPFGPAVRSVRVDLTKSPGQPGFVIETLEGAGASAMGGGGRLYGIGPGGIVARVIPIAPCPADFNSSGTVDVFDIIAFLQAYAANDPAADLNNDGVIDFFDLQGFLGLFASGCP